MQRDSDEMIEAAAAANARQLDRPRAMDELGVRRDARREDFLYDRSQEGFWDRVTRTLHKAGAVDRSIPLVDWNAGPRGGLIRPSAEIGQINTDANNQFVESSSWLPGRPEIVPDMLATADCVVPMLGGRIYNTYQRPAALREDEGRGIPWPWLRLMRRHFPSWKDRKHLIDYLAHMVQHPEEKPNHGIVMIGPQGSGKDSLLAPLIDAVGVTNHRTIQQAELNDKFGELGEQILLIVNEMVPQRGGEKSWHLYDKLKPLMASPPLMLRVERKHWRFRYVVNVVRVIIMTNYDTAVFLDADDRRLFILRSVLGAGWHIDAGDPDFFAHYWRWLDHGGRASVSRFLMNRSLKNFNPKQRAPSTEVKEEIVASWNEPNEVFDDAVTRAGSPDVLLPEKMLVDDFDRREDLRFLLRQRMLRLQAARRSGYEVVHPMGGSNAKFVAAKERTRYAFVKSELVKALPRMEVERLVLVALVNLAKEKREAAVNPTSAKAG